MCRLGLRRALFGGTFALFGFASSYDGLVPSLPDRNENCALRLYSSFVRVDLVVDATAAYTGLACPRVDVRTRLAGLHVPHAALVPEIADLRVVAFLRSVLHAHAGLLVNIELFEKEGFEGASASKAALPRPKAEIPVHSSLPILLATLACDSFPRV